MPWLRGPAKDLWTIRCDICKRTTKQAYSGYPTARTDSAVQRQREGKNGHRIEIFTCPLCQTPRDEKNADKWSAHQSETTPEKVQQPCAGSSSSSTVTYWPQPLPPPCRGCGKSHCECPSRYPKSSFPKKHAWWVGHPAAMHVECWVIRVALSVATFRGPNDWYCLHILCLHNCIWI